MNKRLPDDFPAYFLAHATALPAQVQGEIEDRLGLRRSGVFDTHPSPGDRIRKARRAGNPGIFLSRPRQPASSPTSPSSLNK